MLVAAVLAIAVGLLAFSHLRRLKKHVPDEQRPAAIEEALRRARDKQAATGMQPPTAPRRRPSHGAGDGGRAA